MKYTVLLYLFLCIANIHAQEKGTIKIGKPQSPKPEAKKNVDTTSHHHLFELTVFSFEQKYFLSDFGKQLKTLNQYQMEQPCNYISLSIITDQYIGPYRYPSYFIFSYLLPANITVNDSIKERLNGYNMRFSFLGQNIIRKKHLGLFFTEGLTFGRLKLVNEDKEKLKNAILAPYIGLVIRGTIKRLTFFAISEFNYDLSSAKWKKTWVSKKQQESIPSFKQSGLNFSIGINYSMNKLYLD
jgi:hypothetical protein